MPAIPYNRLLNALSAASRRSFENKLEAVPLPVRTGLFEAGRVPKYAYFVTSGIASVVVDMENGGAVEVGLLGCEALPGCFHVVGPQEGSSRCFMQVGGTGLRMNFSQLLQEFHSNTELRTRMLQCIQYEGFTSAQLSGCNRLHGIEERLARWLLMVSDRIGSDDLPLTQEFLGEMLGSRRSSVTVSAGVLQRAGLIEYHMGRVHILDRENLANAACECYPVVKRFHANLYGDSIQSI